MTPQTSSRVAPGGSPRVASDSSTYICTRATSGLTGRLLTCNGNMLITTHAQTEVQEKRNPLPQSGVLRACRMLSGRIDGTGRRRVGSPQARRHGGTLPGGRSLRHGHLQGHVRKAPRLRQAEGRRRPGPRHDTPAGSHGGCRLMRLLHMSELQQGRTRTRLRQRAGRSGRSIEVYYIEGEQR